MTTIAAGRFRMTKLVVSFNRHFFAIAIAACVALAAVSFVAVAPSIVRVAAAIGAALAAYFMVASIIASYFVYDRSDLYRLASWPAQTFGDAPRTAVVIHAGFDPASEMLRAKYPATRFTVMSFFDPKHTTEASIQRAHRLFPPRDDELHVSPHAWPLASASQDVVLALSAAHELRDDAERAKLFVEAKRVVARGGKIVVIEQLRDLANFACFGFAAFHFLSRRTWLRSFAAAGLAVERELSLSPFMRVFVLR
jgi:hypothetical protein